MQSKEKDVNKQEEIKRENTNTMSGKNKMSAIKLFGLISAMSIFRINLNG